MGLSLKRTLAFHCKAVWAASVVQYNIFFGLAVTFPDNFTLPDTVSCWLGSFTSNNFGTYNIEDTWDRD
ncbi:hypothetical protein DL93DRAFT_2086382 [Clavulina sp. PMI_390]|nr:hypothetical protein DL93DRAFT_2086382 [Clavulina sp. PMI_390]